MYDHLSRTKFLINTGADVSVIPAPASQRSLPPTLHLHAASNTKIPVHHNLIVDLKGRQLVDPLTALPTRSQTAPGDSSKQSYHVTHHIETTGPPVHAKARRLAPERFKEFKVEFECLISHGIIRPSSSKWLSVLHIVPNKNGNIRP
ncbi:uncharacterized protein LOC143033166 [Oratosquilla oratoria]|uniref:uncharacterized protein LOC143033166 n=1 Tax=Oratosquilla oratoria TaxID=337810 RepID=UPI003F763B89